ncbi:MAG: urease accessory protein UreJ [Oscillatoriales cyanobacterium CG2_30_44_21]|nr:MAG: urease accessory protein UreJ [Oscillatoriales cyanobacterium CG2_30_44_21]
MNLSKIFSLVFASVQNKALAIAFAFSFLVFASPAAAHHAMGGKTPSNFIEGFYAGLAHPVIGFDHLAFIIAVGLFAAVKKQGFWIPLAFVGSAAIGTGLHLLSIDLPLVELAVAVSVFGFGVLLVTKNSPNYLVVAALAAIAGLFHGHAYGEAIFGAESMALWSYLAGFTIIQLVISGAAFFAGKKVLSGDLAIAPNLRSAGLVICGIGASLLASQISALIFPAA